MLSFSLPAHSQPQLLPEVLRHLKISLTLRRKLKKASDAILVNNHPVPWNTLIHPGDTVSINWPSDCTIEPHALPLTICYEDSSLLVIDKPAGLLVHPASGNHSELTLANAVIHHLKSETVAPSFHPVHRLDRNTSGLLLVAKNPYCQHLFSVSSDKNLRRSYLAVVTGIPSPPEGIIDAPIGRLAGSIIERSVQPDGQNAITHYKTLAVFPQHSLVELRLETGRTHQIRVHLSYIGHPIVGDDLYGGSRELISRQALHATRLQFIHPISGEPLDITSPLPEDIEFLINNLQNQ
ncbi:MAG: pseudouridine synthase, RluA family [Firmicutes bacterium]|nr:pseudouridine synthase, RluA family [Bacillota bacterium]